MNYLKARVILVLGLLVGGMIITPVITGCSSELIEPGHVGIKVPLYGEDRGVDNITIETGRVWYNDWTTRIYVYPNYMLRAIWTKDSNEGSPTDEGITFSCEGVQIGADIAANYQIKRERIPHVFVKLRGIEDKEKVVREFMRGKIRDAINNLAGSMTLKDLYGPGREKLLVDAKKRLIEEIGDDFDIDMVTFIGALRWPPNIEAAINRTIEAQQSAAAAREKVEQIKAEAEQAKEEATGLAEAKKTEALGVAQANDSITKSLTPALLQYRALEKWDGKLPQFMSGDTQLPFITVPAAAVAPTAKE